MASRIESTIVDGINEDGARPAPAAALDAATIRGDDAERLIGDRPSRWISLAGLWLATAFSVAFGLYVNIEAQGIEGSFFEHADGDDPALLLLAAGKPAAISRTAQDDRRPWPGPLDVDAGRLEWHRACGVHGDVVLQLRHPP